MDVSLLCSHVQGVINLNLTDAYYSRLWFQVFFLFTLTWGRWTHFDKYVSNGLVQPPTRIRISWMHIILPPLKAVPLLLGRFAFRTLHEQWKKPGWLGCIGDYTTQVYRDCNQLSGGFKYFYFHPYLVTWSNLTNIFQTGWNHQLVQTIKVISFFFRGSHVVFSHMFFSLSSYQLMVWVGGLGPVALAYPCSNPKSPTQTISWCYLWYLFLHPSVIQGDVSKNRIPKNGFVYKTHHPRMIPYKMYILFLYRISGTAPHIIIQGGWKPYRKYNSVSKK